MKKTIFVAILMLLSISLQAQNQYKAYCNVLGYNFWGVGKVSVQLDLGHKNYDCLYGEDGKPIKFDTMMGVLDYMAKRGWNTIGTYFISELSGPKVIHYLLEKTITDDTQITDGLNLKKAEKEEKPYKRGQASDDMY